MEHLRILGSGNGEVQEMEEGTILKKRRGEEYILEMRSDIHGNQYQKHKKKEKEITFIDKRRHRRHLLVLPIKYYLGDPSIGRPGFTVNISEEGLAIELPERLKVGGDLRLKILQKAQGSIEIIGKVVWTMTPARSGEVHQTGVRIVQLSAQNRSKLESLLVTASY